MKIVLAPDSFKGNLTSAEVCECLERAIRAELPQAEVVSIPMADGGEGTAAALARAWGGSRRRVTVTGPLSDMKVKATYTVHPDGRCAAMEMAAASGIELLPGHLLDPMRTTTYGTGELLAAILDEGFRDIIVGVGGSATVDGGVGMAQALGYTFLDIDGRRLGPGGECLARISTLESKHVHPALSEARIRVAADVTNPLLGPTGAARVFGPQKGADEAMVPELENGLANLKRVLQKAGLTGEDAEGDGAAGGLGYGLRMFCGATLCSGAELIAEATGLERHLAGADMLITGEGRTDGQTAGGKLCSVMAALARRHGVPTVLISGALAGRLDDLWNLFDAAFSISSGHGSIEQCLAGAKTDLAFTVRNTIRMIYLHNACQ